MRTETLVFKTRLEKAAVDRHRDALKTIGYQYLDDVGVGDTFVPTLTVNLEYFGGVEAKLAAFETLLDDPDLVIDASIEELEHGHSVLVSLVDRISRFKSLLAVEKASREIFPAVEAAVEEVETETKEPKEPKKPSFWAQLRDWWIDL